MSPACWRYRIRSILPAIRFCQADRFPNKRFHLKRHIAFVVCDRDFPVISCPWSKLRTFIRYVDRFVGNFFALPNIVSRIEILRRGRNGYMIFLLHNSRWIWFQLPAEFRSRIIRSERICGVIHLQCFYGKRGSAAEIPGAYVISIAADKITEIIF